MEELKSNEWRPYLLVEEYEQKAKYDRSLDFKLRDGVYSPCHCNCSPLSMGGFIEFLKQHDKVEELYLTDSQLKNSEELFGNKWLSRVGLRLEKPNLRNGKAFGKGLIMEEFINLSDYIYNVWVDLGKPLKQDIINPLKATLTCMAPIEKTRSVNPHDGRTFYDRETKLYKLK